MPTSGDEVSAQLGQTRLKGVANLVAGQPKIGVELLHGAQAGAVEAKAGPDHGSLQGGEVVEEVWLGGMQAHGIEIDLAAGIGDVALGREFRLGRRPTGVARPEVRGHGSFVALSGADVKAYVEDELAVATTAKSWSP